MEDVRISGRGYDQYNTPSVYGVFPAGGINGGLLPQLDWKQALVLRGFGWQFSHGELDASQDNPFTGGGAGTVLDLDQPEFGISVPTGFTLIPLRLLIAARPGLQTTDSHINDAMIIADRTAKYAGDGTATVKTPINMRTETSGGCPATCFAAATADITDPVPSVTLARLTKLTDVQGTAATVNMYDLTLNYEPNNPPMIQGPGAIYGYFGGSIAVVGFMSAQFLVVPTSMFAGLS